MSNILRGVGMILTAILIFTIIKHYKLKFAMKQIEHH